MPDSQNFGHFIHSSQLNFEDPNIKIFLSCYFTFSIDYLFFQIDYQMFICMHEGLFLTVTAFCIWSSLYFILHTIREKLLFQQDENLANMHLTAYVKCDF